MPDVVPILLTMPPSGADKNVHFCLESSGKQADVPERIELAEFPATIGRHPDCLIRLPLARLSRRHARLDFDGQALTVQDLGSTNGTFVNRVRISAPVRLQVGDVLHLADHEFRLMAQPARSDQPGVDLGAETVVGMAALPRDFPLHMPAFLEMLENQQVSASGQPVVTAAGELYGLELLGRSSHPRLKHGPDQLFALAATVGAEARLSRMLRRQSFLEADLAGLRLPLFFNSHPAECVDMPALMAEMHALRERHPKLDLIFEMHEAAVSDPIAMAEVKEELAFLDIALAYDDFGAGQARLLELVEVPPDYLKFDMTLISDMGDRTSPRYRLLTELHRMISGMGIKTLVEGVEDAATAALCREIGIDYMQGYFFGRPRPLAEYYSPPERE